MSAELFEIEESLSPRLRWMKKHGVQTNFCCSQCPYPWIAWDAANTEVRERPEDDPLPSDHDACGYGDTEMEAVEDLAEKMGAVNWIDLTAFSLNR